jgi:hypothetical protein
VLFFVFTVVGVVTFSSKKLNVLEMSDTNSETTPGVGADVPPGTPSRSNASVDQSTNSPGSVDEEIDDFKTILFTKFVPNEDDTFEIEFGDLKKKFFSVFKKKVNTFRLMLSPGSNPNSQ